VNLCTERAPTNAELTHELAHQVHRPAFFRVPASVIGPAAGQMSNELLASVNCVPAALLASGFAFRDPDVGAVLREGLNPSR
jgi:NAD dependent epimerase/dehydratase family enzyme